MSTHNSLHFEILEIEAQWNYKSLNGTGDNTVLTGRTQGQRLLPILEHTIWCKGVRIVAWCGNMRISVRMSLCEEEDESPLRQPGAIRALVLCFLPAEQKTKTSEYNWEMSFFFFYSSPRLFSLHQTEPGDINRETESVRERQTTFPLKWLITRFAITDSTQVTYPINKHPYYKEPKR